MNRNDLKIIIWTTVLIIFSSFQALAEDMKPDLFQVRSVYRAASAGQWGHEIRWIFERTASHERSVRINADSNPSFLLGYSGDKRLTEVARIRIEKDGTKISEPIDVSTAGPYRLSEGHPLPFDDLDAGNENDDAITLKKSAGGVSFAFPLTRKVEPLSVDKAISEAMIPASFKERYPDKRLLMISMLKKGSLMVRQLWVVGEDWWRYEETPFRRSWRVAE